VARAGDWSRVGRDVPLRLHAAGLAGEGVAALALLALIVEGIIAVSRRILGPRFP